MPKKASKHPHLVNWHELPEVDYSSGEFWGDRTRRLTPSMKSEEGHLGINRVRLPPGTVSCPFHWHVKEDEVFIVLEGTGLLRYGDETLDVRSGDCISFPRNSGQGHQLANVSDQDLVYLAIGENCSDEVCVYPDTGKVMIRALHRIVRPADVKYMDGEPDPPLILGPYLERRGAKPRKPAKRRR